MTKVFLSAGHGGADPGAVGNGLKEKAINLTIMLACRDELKRNGFSVVCSRTTDANDPVQQEVAEANASGADVAVSFHTNAGGGDGSETYYWASSSQGKKLAALCEKHAKTVGQNSRGIKAGNHLMFINSTSMTAVLCECAFIDNKKDISVVDTTAEQKALGVAYAKAIMECFGIVPKTAAKTGKWLKVDNKWKYRKANGACVKSAWEKVDGKWYRFDNNGVMLFNSCWKIDGKWYAFNKDGAMLEGSIKLNSGGDMRLN